MSLWLFKYEGEDDVYVEAPSIEDAIKVWREQPVHYVVAEDDNPESVHWVSGLVVLR